MISPMVSPSFLLAMITFFPFEPKLLIPLVRQRKELIKNMQEVKHNKKTQNLM